MPADQSQLLEIPEQPASAPPPKATRVKGRPRLKPIDRSQGILRPIIVEELVAPDHKVRAIWDLTGLLDLGPVVAQIQSVEGRAGSPAWNPRLLLSTWLYCFSEGVTSARKIESLMGYEPALMWLSGLGEINYHTLSDFRSQHGEEFKRWLSELLGLLSQEGLVKLERVAHDGTKIRAQAGMDTFRRETTLQERIAEARQMVEELEKQEKKEADGGEARREAARQRAAKERLERMELAAEELKKIRALKETEQEQQQARVSLTEPEARFMKHGDGAIVPSYNVQISTDCEKKIVVGVELTQCSSDAGSLLPAMEEIKATTGQYPQAVVADGGFTNQAAIEGMKEKQIEFHGSLAEVEVKQAAALKAAGIDPAFGPSAFQVIEEKKTLQCPAGKTLPYIGPSKKRDTVYHQYRAQAVDCCGCEYQAQCCPRAGQHGRLVSIRASENGEVAEFRKKMKTEEARQIYAQRGPVAEFPNCWIKEKLGLRKFRLRGLAKAATEAALAVLTYDAMQWMRLSWRPKLNRAQAVAA